MFSLKNIPWKALLKAFVKTMVWLLMTTFFAFLPIFAAAVLVRFAPAFTTIKSAWLIPDWLFVSTTLVAATATDYYFGSHRSLPRLIEGPIYLLLPVAITFFIALIYTMEHLPISQNGAIDIAQVHKYACITAILYAFVGKFGQFTLEPHSHP